MGIDINELPEKYRRQILEKIGADTPPKTTHNKQNPCNEHLGAKKVKGFDRPVNITYLDKRGRLTDPDGGFTKYFTDSLVSCGVLQNDSAKEVGKIERVQRKGKEDRLIIVIEIIESR